MKQTKIAILLATYNGEKYLRPLLESLFAQTEQDWQLLVSDDHSRDATPEILEEYAARYPDRIRLLSYETASGSSKANFLRLTSQAEGFPYLMYCDQDDVWKPDKIQKTLACMQRLENGQPEVPCLVHTDLAVTDADLNVQHESMFYSAWMDAKRCDLRYLLVQNVVTGCTMMINAALRELAMLPADTQGMLMHDWWCALWASARGRIGFLPESTIFYRQHGDNAVGAKEVRNLRYLTSAFSRLDEHRQDLIATELQTAVFAQAATDYLTPEQRRMVTDFARIRQKSKPGRLAVIFRHGIWLLGWKRKIGQFLLI